VIVISFLGIFCQLFLLRGTEKCIRNSQSETFTPLRHCAIVSLLHPFYCPWSRLQQHTAILKVNTTMQPEKHKLLLLEIWTTTNQKSADSGLSGTTAFQSHSRKDLNPFPLHRPAILAEGPGGVPCQNAPLPPTGDGRLVRGIFDETSEKRWFTWRSETAKSARMTIAQDDSFPRGRYWPFSARLLTCSLAYLLTCLLAPMAQDGKEER
jgi:hypothetical protein